jgi:hypothetical protein
MGFRSTDRINLNKPIRMLKFQLASAGFSFGSRASDFAQDPPAVGPLSVHEEFERRVVHGFESLRMRELKT